MIFAGVVVATVSGFLTVGLWPGEKPTVNRNTVDRGYRCASLEGFLLKADG
jgi:hypothetical protein